MSGLETIVAIATAPAMGAVGIVRLSGKNLKEITYSLLGKSLEPRKASLIKIFDQHNNIIDTGLGIYFSAPNSFTGEDVLELQCHGGRVILDMVLKRCVALGARMAEPGEFSQRAFLNDKIDLCQCEAIADLISANTEKAVQSAQRSLSGVFSKKVDRLQNDLTELRVYVEAAIDFVDEEIDFLSDGKILNALEAIIAQLSTLLENAKKGVILNEGRKVVIAGQPNVGKSSLFNLLVQNEAAIVTSLPGTTRDIIKETIQVNGIPVHLLDTAGIREAGDVVEIEGIRRAKEQFKIADQILLLVDATSKPLLSNFETEILQEYPNKTLLVLNKIDLVKELPQIKEAHLKLSVTNEHGVDALYEVLSASTEDEGEEGVFSARRRHVEALKKAKTSVSKAHIQLIQYKAGELVAQDLRQAQDYLSEITGKISSDDLLGKIFSTFCIGK